MTATTDPSLRSFVPVPPESDFPIQNLPFGVFRPRSGGPPRVGVAIGEMVLDLAVLERERLVDVAKPGNKAGETFFDRSSLNAFMTCGRPVWNAVRERLSVLLRDNEPRLRDDAALRREAIVPMADVEMLLPV